MLTSNSTQFFRYAVVGILSNLLGYAVYLIISWLGVAPKVAMTGMYFLGALMGYFGNKSWSFSYSGNILGSFGRYWLAHLGGYALNFSILYLFVDNLGYMHQIVQGIAIFIVAAYLFVMFKFFVFPVAARFQE